jgi:hypothetical protein
MRSIIRKHAMPERKSMKAGGLAVSQKIYWRKIASLIHLAVGVNAPSTTPLELEHEVRAQRRTDYGKVSYR